MTFVHVVRPTVLALAGGLPEPLLPIPVRAAFTYKKKAGRREYVRVFLAARAQDGALEAVKFPRGGRGLLSSLVETDGPRRARRRNRHGRRARAERRLLVLRRPDLTPLR